MRIAVYTIAHNEEAFVSRWVSSTADADYRLVADTGSTDHTVAILDGMVNSAHISVRPWRFDDARNAALALLPSDVDVVISLDMDEVLVPGWRSKLETAWQSETTRLKYGYVWSWANGQPETVFHSDKIAGRHTHRWKHPVHEVLVPTEREVVSICDDILIEHHPDSRKPRSQYLHLLELAVQESPDDDRCSHYLGREYFFHARYTEAIAEFKRHLNLPRATWKEERAASYRYIAKCYEELGRITHAQESYVHAVLEAPSSRESLVAAAQFALTQNDCHGALHYCHRVFALPRSATSYISDRYAQNEGAYDLASTAYLRLGQIDSARRYAQEAVRQNPHDPRLQQNLARLTIENRSSLRLT